MKLHEYQAKGIFKKSGIPIPDGQLITEANQASEAVQHINGPPGSSRLKSMPVVAVRRAVSKW